MLQMRLALTGRGDYGLAPAYRHYSVHPHVWSCKTDEKIEKIFDDFVHRRRPKSIPVRIMATDGKLDIPNLTQAGKKPDQRKRTKACRLEHVHLVNLPVKRDHSRTTTPTRFYDT